MPESLLEPCAAPPAPGYFGKVPARGDFITRRLPREFTERWDAWLQDCLPRSREQLGEQWLDVYLTSPVWRFVLSSHICGPSAWAGVFLPSVDKVGRYFPFTLCTSLVPGESPLSVLEASWSVWFADAEDLAVSCLEEDLDLDAFDARVQTHLRPTGVAVHGVIDGVDASPATRMAPKPAWRHAIRSVDAPSASYPALLDALLTKLTGQFSLWWTNGSDHIEPSLLVCQGLPHLDGYAAMLDGQWGGRGWGERTVQA